MKGRARAKDKSAQEERLELKYCERCGSLWLGPVGGGANLLRGLRARDGAIATGFAGAGNGPAAAGTAMGADDGDFEGYAGDEEVDLDASGGVA